MEIRRGRHGDFDTLLLGTEARLQEARQGLLHTLVDLQRSKEPEFRETVKRVEQIVQSLDTLEVKIGQTMLDNASAG